MALTTQTSGTTGLAGLYTSAFLEKKFVSELKKKLLAARLGVDSTIGTGMGATVVRWQYFGVPTALTTSLTEGDDTATSTNHTTTTAEAILGEYEGITKFSRRLMITALSGTMSKFSELLGYQAALTIDSLVLQEIDGTTTTVDSGTAMTADAVRQGVRALEVEDAQPHRSTGGQNFVGIFHADSLYDMLGEGTPAWFQAKDAQVAHAYVNPFKDTMPSAGLYNAILFKSNNIQNVSSEYLNVLVADDSFGVAALDSNVIQPRVIPTWPDDNVASPGRVYGFLAWWIYFATEIFDVKRVAVVKADI